MRILLVALASAPVRGLVDRLRDPDLEFLVCASAQEALERVGPIVPDVVIIDGSLPGRDVFRLYGRLRAIPTGAAVPIIFTAHVRSDADAVPGTAPDFYLGPDATLHDVEQLLFTFLPESLVVEEGAEEEGQLSDDPPPVARVPSQRDEHTGPTRPAPTTSGPPSWSELLARLRTGPATVALIYLGVYALGEVLAAGLDARLGLLVHGGLLLAIFFHGANVPAGPERAYFWTLWLAPLTRIYGLAQPYTDAPPLYWWALTAIPMVIAGLVAMRLGGQTARDARLIPGLREAPVAVFMVPVGLALGVLTYLLLEPRTLARELALGGPIVVALVVIVNPGIVDEIVFRGVLQRPMAGLLGPVLGTLYAGLLYAPVVPAGLAPGGSLVAVAITFILGLLFSALTARTGSILSAAVAHASLAVGLFVIAPTMMPSGLTPTIATPSPPSAGDARSPIPKPGVIVASPPSGPATASTQPGAAGQSSPAVPPGQTAPPNQAAPPSQPGQAPPLGLATPITLATPLPPAVQAPPGQPPAAPPTGPVGQAVVVRGTGGAGARLRSQPGNSGQILTVVPENTPLLIIGPDRMADGLTWRNVRAPNGSEGWIAANFVTTGQ